MDKIAVNCTSNSESETVINWTFDNNLTKLKEKYKQSAPTKICIKGSNDIGCHNESDWFEKNGYTIISYQEFERDYLKKPKEKEYWYLKHTPEITEEVFNQLRDKLDITLGKQYNHANLDVSYSDFKRNKYIRTSTIAENKKGWCIDNNSQYIKTEKFLSDILSIKSPEIELIEGKWYELSNGRCVLEIPYIVKYKSKGGNGTLQGSKYFTRPKKYHGKDSEFDFGGLGDYTWKPANMEEVWKLFPEERPKSEELTSLPEKWCILGGSEFGKYVREWEELYSPLKINIAGSETFYYWNILNDANAHTGWEYNKNKPEDRKLITFDQFKKLTQLKESLIKEESSIPEYVRFHSKYNGMFVEGRIYKRKNNGDETEFEDINGGSIFCTGWRLHSTPSNKESYEAQNKPIPSPSIEEDWCVKLDEHNKQAIIEWWKDMGWNGSGELYGMKKGVKTCDYTYFSKFISITTEEFYKKIGKETPKVMKYAIGPIQFKGKKGGDYISSYEISIPNVKHGFTQLGDPYNAKIVDFHKDLYCVEYTDASGKQVCIGFKEEFLEPAKPSESDRWPIGTKVRINPYGSYPKQGGGSIGFIESYNKGSDHIYRVEWEKDISNVYGRSDLLLAEEVSSNKEITLIKDRYYSCIHENRSKFFFQFNRLDDDCLYVKAHREEREKWNEYSSTWIYSKNSQFKEVTESEAKGIVAPAKEENLVGRWAKVVSNHEFGYGVHTNMRCNSKSFYTIGKIGKIVKDDEKWSDRITKWVQFEGCNNAITLNQLELMPLGWSPEAKSIDSMSKEELLEEAKRRYPIGTKFNCLHLSYNKGVSVERDDFTIDSWCIRTQGSWGCACIYDGKNWAEIVENDYGVYIQPNKANYSISIDPYYKELSISDVFKPKKSVKMSYIAENLQNPRQLSKVVKTKHVTI